MRPFVDFMSERSELHYLLIGQVLRPHGIKGELRVRILTDYPERLRSLKQLFIGKDPYQKNQKNARIQGVRFHQDYLLLQLEEVNNRDLADRLRGYYLMIDIENAVPLEEGEVYAYQMIGLDIFTDQGKHLGKLSEILETGANDVYIVQSEQYGEILIPAHDETVLEINLEKERIIVQLPDGLLPD
ncbi:ribosome maturation factor RimM [Anaerolineales bacterium]